MLIFDLQCDPSLLCINGACVTPEPATCSLVDSQCGPNPLCFCIPAFNGQNYCADIGADLRCTDYPACSSDADCGYGNYCANTGLETCPGSCFPFIACI